MLSPQNQSTSIRANWPKLLPHQREALFWQPAGQVGRLAIVGGWGFGKSLAASLRFLRCAFENPWTPAYGDNNPKGVLVAPTMKIAYLATVPMLLRHLPSELILKKDFHRHHYIMLSNGFKIVIHSGESELEGVDACAVWIDEIQHDNFANNTVRYMNLFGRLRDPFANKALMIVSGLPESGWVRETFEAQDENNKTILGGTKDNPHIPKDLITQFYANCPSGFEESLLGGQWMAPPNAVYPQFDPAIHVVDTPPDHNAVTHVGLDVGNFGAILFAQKRQIRVKDVMGYEYTDHCIEIVDQILTNNDSVDAQAYQIKMNTKWNIQDGASLFCVDPMIRKDEIFALRKHFPQSHVIKRERGHNHFPVENGIRIVQRGLRDAVGNTRLFFNRRLLSETHGIISAVEKYRRNTRSQDPVRDNTSDHPLDALRYLCCELIPTAKPQNKTY